MEKESQSIMQMTKNKELNMQELLKMIFVMDLEKLFGKMEVLIKVYFNLKKHPNLDIVLFQMEPNSLDFVKKINNKDSDQQCTLMEKQKFRITLIIILKVNLSEERKMENSTQKIGKMENELEI